MRKLVLLVVIVFGLGLSACGSDDDPAMEAGGGAGSAAAEHNDADVQFAQNMIPHHSQAIEMADLVIAGGVDPEVKALANRIKGEQGPEIETMRGWLRQWGESEQASGDMPGMDMGGQSGMGMMSDDDMRKLQVASGAELDRMFLEMMTEHHRGAIEMARTEVEDGRYPPAKDLAEKIGDDQQAEIDEMQALLGRLRG